MDGAFNQGVSFPLLSVRLVWPPILLLTPPALGQHLPTAPPYPRPPWLTSREKILPWGMGIFDEIPLPGCSENSLQEPRGQVGICREMSP